MASIDHSEKPSIHLFHPLIFQWTSFLMHLGRKWIYGGQIVYILKDACRAWPKTAKIKDGRQRPVQQNTF